ncbi:hypothetical protein D1F64_15705 [Breoghania sp. L-A4]|nr:hypothetical protein D1F64_15705 [Breoghania sp. L-A4]
MNSWLEEAFNIDPGFARGLQFVIALLIVLGLIAVFVWILRRLSGVRVGRGPRNRQPRIAVMDTTALDARRRLILVRRDNIEHLLLVGGPSDVVVEQNIVRGQPAQGYGRQAAQGPVAATQQAPLQAPQAPPPAPQQHPASARPMPAAQTPPPQQQAQPRAPQPQQPAPQQPAPRQPATAPPAQSSLLAGARPYGGAPAPAQSANPPSQQSGPSGASAAVARARDAVDQIGAEPQAQPGYRPAAAPQQSAPRQPERPQYGRPGAGAAANGTKSAETPSAPEAQRYPPVQSSSGDRAAPSGSPVRSEVANPSRRRSARPCRQARRRASRHRPRQPHRSSARPPRRSRLP